MTDTNVAQKEQFVKTLYAYTSILKQMGARYDDHTIKSSCAQLEDLYQYSIGTDPNNIEEKENILFKLKLCVLNLQISIVNSKYMDLNPICEFFSYLLKDMES